MSVRGAALLPEHVSAGPDFDVSVVRSPCIRSLQRQHAQSDADHDRRVHVVFKPSAAQAAGCCV